MKLPSREQCLMLIGLCQDSATTPDSEFIDYQIFEVVEIVRRAYKAGADAMREEAANITADQRWMVLDPLRTYNAHENMQSQKQTAEYLTRRIRNLKVGDRK